MEQIVKNLLDPSWWFTGIFFILVGIILTKFFFNWTPYLFKKVGSYLPKKIELLRRRKKKRKLIVIKNYRQNDMKVIWLIGRYWTLVLLAFMVAAVIAIFYSLSDDFSINIFSNRYQVILVLSSYILMLYVVAEKKLLKEVIDAHHHWKRMTKLPSKDRSSD